MTEEQSPKKTIAKKIWAKLVVLLFILGLIAVAIAGYFMFVRVTAFYHNLTIATEQLKATAAQVDTSLQTIQQQLQQLQQITEKMNQQIQQIDLNKKTEPATETVSQNTTVEEQPETQPDLSELSWWKKGLYYLSNIFHKIVIIKQDETPQGANQ
jgi:hypothetical protein